MINKLKKGIVVNRFNTYVKISEYILDQPVRLLIVSTLSVLGAIFSGLSIGLIIPLLGGNDRNIFEDTFFEFLDDFININFGSEKYTEVINIALLIVFLSFLEMLISILIIQISTNFEKLFLEKNLNLLFAHLNDIKYVDFFKYESGNIFTLFTNDLYQISTIIRRALLSIQQIILIFVYFIILVSVSPFMSIFSFFIFIIISILSTGYIGRKSKSLNKELSKLVIRINSKFNHLLDNFKNIRSLNLDNEKLNEVNELYGVFVNRRMSYHRFSNYPTPVNNFINILAIASVILFGSFLFRNQTESWTILLVPFLVIILKLIPVVSQVNQVRILIESIEPFIKRFELFKDQDVEPNTNDELFIFNDKISFKNVSFTYSEEQVLKKVNLSILKNKITGIIGTSGSGKSTIVDLLLKIYDPDGGQILIDEKDISIINKNSLRKNISFMPQNIFIDEKSIVENVLLKNSMSENKIENLMREINLFSDLSSKNLTTELEYGGKNISGGQKQKINFLRAITKQAGFIILDEPTNNLDDYSVEVVSKFIKEKSKNSTILIIAHDHRIIDLCDKIYKIDNGLVSQIS